MNVLSNWAGRPVVASPLLAVVAVAVYGSPSLSRWLELDRSKAAAGEWWRLVTGHLTHWSFEHLLWDVLAFSVLAFVCERRGRPSFLPCLVVAAGAVSSVLWVFHPEVAVYRGLSGVNAALFFVLATSLLIEESGLRVAAAIALLAFAVKMVFELATGSSLFVSDTGVVELVASAHVAGSAAGVLSALSSAKLASSWTAVSSCSASPPWRSLRGRRARRRSSGSTETA